MSSTHPAGAQPAHAPLSLDDPSEIGGYRVHARLGSGGMGVVYLAYTPGGRPIAVKVVREDFAADPEFRRRFAQEVASACRIHGLFTAQVVDHGVDEAVPWLATAYVPGPSLQQVVERHGPLPARTVLLLVAGIAEALQAIHAAGVVHRDLKPANVLIAEDGPRVIDFGIARAADATGLTGTGLRIGTAAYMAPEQALGLPVTSATDVFALGALAAYVAGGALPFGTGPESAALYRVVHEPADLSRVSGELRALLGWCLAKRPEERPTPAELIAAVREHAAVGATPEFSEGWLPGAVRQEIAGRGAGTAPAHPSDRTPPPLHAQPTSTATPAPVRPPTQRVPADEGAKESRRRARRRGGRTALLAGATAAVLALAGGAVYYLSAPEGPSDAAPEVTYTHGFSDVELTAPDNGYEFDLATGKVVPAETAGWYLAREGEELVVPENTDAFVASGDSLSPAECERGIDSEPVTRLPLDDLADERPFCVRSSDGERLVIARLVEAGPAGGPVTVVVGQHRVNR
ncbi:serine/threonine-protein kinase [Streptomyces sp. NBC_00572]|uniref:serine/threonine-protein kinase n=1 Tax=Streptomyces sp. NBC_00572 TaxID=2903664 RepID=UPI002251B648|nr:serine/threonine-protein kinase [Streptomyces sp. NBC_00572]MCX4985300.1 serine/threonine protein kinase [Streptomyces sp. NBC_00572]